MKRQLIVTTVALGIWAAVRAQEKGNYELPPISYSEAQANDGMAGFRARLTGGKLNLGTTDTNRWGGWYVTGKHGAALHRGNLLSREKKDRLTADFRSGANVTNLSRFFEAREYQSGSSDIVALLVLEHQTAIAEHPNSSIGRLAAHACVSKDAPNGAKRAGDGRGRVRQCKKCSGLERERNR